MENTASSALTVPREGFRDIGFAVAIIFMLTVLFLPLPPIMVDFGLALSIAFSVLILMVALWIQTPLQFSSFPTVLLLATMMRLALNIATTRLILTDGSKGSDAAGHVIGGFSTFVMGGDFVIGIIVFVILLTVNFIVITKGATRIAEVGARFTLDAIPGKQMAIDADLSAGLLDEKEAQRRRRELEEESSFFGSMDGASKFVRGDAIAGLIITAVNIFGGMIIGVLRHGMSVGEAVDVFTRLSVGDGLVTQIPALIVALAAGMIVSKGGTKGSAEKAVLGQLGNHPRALFMASMLMFIFALLPALPFVPFALIGAVLAFLAYSIPQKWAEEKAAQEADALKTEMAAQEKARESVKESLNTVEIELCFGRQLSSGLARSHSELAQRVAKMRRKFARQYGFVVPEIKLSDDLLIESKAYQIKIHGTVMANEELRLGDMLVIVGDRKPPQVPGEPAREPAFGMKAMWVPQTLAKDVKNEGFVPVDNLSVLLTHLSEILRNNLAQLLSYKDMRSLLDRLPAEYRRLLDEIAPQHISYSGIQAVLKLLLAERVSIRNLHLILEAIAEIAPHSRRTEQIVEHVRVRIGQQICGDLSENGVLSVLRLGSRWDLAFHESLKRDSNGEVVQFDLDPRMIEEFSKEASKVIRGFMDKGKNFALVTSPDARPYVRLITERLFANLPVLSHVEISRSVQVESLGTIS
ncbi:Flagellar biosynthesis protein FlhA [Candidatus Filomicrobium marinum]|uniref:Flagellar biosynthesis protein FlhA n=2 Tax=Filomicrobium TaxID=119044 RepID=A0A0D6JKE0_9HYPH|nr:MULTISPECIES: flagellar biosynthesis protein FlhA [Filomicrobium]MCV0371593.1 flagellar biosynthesis protein FlhA [Filomicrobium sp.]CFX54960.1 Flagellar biosynthesis protein FlhA [Candidatus Filomicrobium marinum]CPR22167.1 Flagellar biosynthesis protein FlhA [Candidatus Filomicrobium marinum]SDO94351.1 flagellar biosynthesis protein FlhA [Filomicrobium insigne]